MKGEKRRESMLIILLGSPTQDNPPGGLSWLVLAESFEQPKTGMSGSLLI